MRNITRCLLLLSAALTILYGCSKNGSTTPTTTKSNAKEIRSFAFNGLTPTVQCTVDNATRTITAVLPSGTNLENLVPTITVSDRAGISPASNVAQNFTNSVTYTVTAQDGSKQTYTTNITTVGGGGGTGSGGIITTYAGSGARGFSGDGGQAILAKLDNCTHVAVDAAGNLYISDVSNFRIRKVSTSGIITTIAGNGTSGEAGDWGQATDASLNIMAGIKVDASGNIYIACADRIRKINTSGIITTVAGGGPSGLSYSGDGGPAVNATIFQPRDIALNAAGDLFIADYGNHRVRKVAAATGIITTILGNGSFTNTGDGGPAIAATTKYPRGLAVDAAGNVYVANYDFVRKINSSGIITTIAGNIAASYPTADGSAATSGKMGGYGMSLDGNGNLFVAVYAEAKIKKINLATGIATTVAGGAYTLGDGGPATLAGLTDPTDVAVDALGNFYIADYNARRIRKVTK